MPTWDLSPDFPSRFGHGGLLLPRMQRSRIAEWQKGKGGYLGEGTRGDIGEGTSEYAGEVGARPATTVRQSSILPGTFIRLFETYPPNAMQRSRIAERREGKRA